MMYKLKNHFKKRMVPLLLLITAPQTIHTREIADWTILTYIQADNNLAPFALKNMQAMQNMAEKNSINVLTHWNKPQYAHAARYEITAKKIIEHESFKPAKHHNNIQESMCASMDWAVETYPARHYMLILWNHGTGVLDRSSPDHNARKVRDLPWLEVPGLDNHYGNRGILYSDSTKTYLNNQQLVTALQHITTKLGKKIDIIGMDACLMAMLEVGYQIKDYADYLVASQNSEPGFGWNYEEILEPLSKKSGTYTPQTVAQLIVAMYKKLYDNKISWYTQSAINLSKIQPIQTTFNDMCNLLLECNAMNHPQTRKIVLQAQEHALKFDTRAFVDLNSFCTYLMIAINDSLASQNNQADQKNPFKKHLKALHVRTSHMNTLINDAVIANETASMFNAAQGISLYCPTGFIQHSYAKTLFSESTSWVKVLNNVLSIYVRPINKTQGHHVTH